MANCTICNKRCSKKNKGINHYEFFCDKCYEDIEDLVSNYQQALRNAEDYVQYYEDLVEKMIEENMKNN